MTDLDRALGELYSRDLERPITKAEAKQALQGAFPVAALDARLKELASIPDQRCFITKQHRKFLRMAMED
jgi:hypothetical protein